ncbi:hypothetical protein J2S73_001351 [Amorphus orientalis]|uniref:Uncharacterized protein n=2 Tax=Amorphus orientalis TaxID=649198 RepID=A0AAE3VMM3_9HYPH|nr:hypothetical protein [Amorphus orientalis]
MVLGGDIVELEHDLILIGGGAHLRVLPGMQIRIL